MYKSKNVSQIKQHMKVLMVNPISSGKIIEKYHELKVARYNNMLARGNFISKNVTEINDNQKTKRWVQSQGLKHGQKIVHARRVQGRNELHLE